MKVSLSNRFRSASRESQLALLRSLDICSLWRLQLRGIVFKPRGSRVDQLRVLITLLFVFVLGACASTEHKSDVTGNVAKSKIVSLPRYIPRTPTSAAEQFSLTDIYSMQRSYWLAKTTSNSETVVRFLAFALKPAEIDGRPADHGRLVVYVESPDQNDQLSLVVDNSKFMYSGNMAGNEPSLSLNRKDSLLIQMGNDAIGRSVWHETITAAYRNNQLIVAGYDYDSYDRLQEENPTNCSLNFLTGKGYSRVFDIKTDRKIKDKKISIAPRTVLLNDWTSEMRPKECD